MALNHLGRQVNKLYYLIATTILLVCFYRAVLYLLVALPDTIIPELENMKTSPVVSLLVFLVLGPSPCAARGRTSSLNKKPEPEPEPLPEPVEDRDYDAASGCQYLGKFRPEPRNSGHGEEKSDWGKTVYTGGFQNCLYHGEGVKRYADGRVYDGDWVLGKPDGVGKFQYKNGIKTPCVI